MADRITGRMGHYAGTAAEAAVARIYERNGYVVADDRWRGPGGEIDLILRGPDGIVFVEVKKSRSFARAAERINARQMARIAASAEAYLANEPAGQLTDMRIDVALVDATGAIRIVENALAGA